MSFTRIETGGISTTAVIEVTSVNISGISTLGSISADSINVSGALTAHSVVITNSLTGPGGVGYATEGYVTNSLVGYATEGYVNNQGFVTSGYVTNSLVGYATEGYVTNSLTTKANLSGANFTGVVTAPNLNITGVGNTATISGAANLVLDPSIVGDNTGTVTILGNLQVDGTQTVINSTTMTVDDLNITLAGGAANASAANGAGITVDGASATLTYASTGDKWVFNKVPYYNTDRLLTTADEGTGNGLDADTLDGVQGASYLRSDANDTFTGTTFSFFSGSAALNIENISSTFARMAFNKLAFYDWNNSKDIVTFDSTVKIDTGNTNNTTTADTSGGLLLAAAAYTDGRYTTRLRKYDNGGGVPLYIDNSSGTANVFTAVARFGAYSGNAYEFEVYGDAAFNGSVAIGSTITIVPYNSLGTLSFEGSAGQLFSITNNLTSGSIFSVNDVSGIPSIDVDADGTIQLATYGGNVEIGSATFFNGGLVEKFEDAGTTLGAQTNNPLSDGNVILFTGNESGNNTINFTGVHSALSQGQSVSFTAIITPNGSGVINAVQVDGVAQTVQWSGGSVPSAGSSGRDVYTFTLLKNGTTTTSYLVFGAATNYA